MSREQPPSIPRKGLSESSAAVYRPLVSEAGPSDSNPNHYHHHHHEGLEEEEEGEEAPPYSGPTSPSMVAPVAPLPQPTYPGLPHLDYSLYSPSTFELSSDTSRITSYSPPLSLYPDSLASLIKSLATVPPKPLVRIVGKREDDPTGVGFDIKLNLMNLIFPEGSQEKSRMNYVKIIGSGEMGFRGGTKASTAPTMASLEEWTTAYCQDGSAIKQFVLERTVTNWDTSYLEGRLLSLVASTDWRGRVEVSFPLMHSRVVVHSPDKVNRFFSNVAKVFTGTKKYEVVKAVWPYADVARGEGSVGRGGRRCVVQSEDAWFESWRDAIRHAVMMKRSGWVTVEDRLEFLMEPRPLESKVVVGH